MSPFYQPAGLAVDKAGSTKIEGLDPASNGEQKSGNSYDELG